MLEPSALPGSGAGWDAVPGAMLVKFRPDLSRAARRRALAAVDASIRWHQPVLDIYLVDVSAPGSTAMDRLRADRDIDWVQPNYIMAGQAIPNDRYYDDFRGVPTDLQKWYLGNATLRAEAAWEITRGRSDVVIAIIDSGVALRHRDLAANLWTNTGEIPGNLVDDDANGWVDDVHGYDFCSGFDPVTACTGRDADPSPDLGDGLDNDNDGEADLGVYHGTFVAGVAGAVANNRIMISGAAPTARLMVVKVLQEENRTAVTNVIDGIVYAVTNGARVINLSLGGGAGLDCATVAPAYQAAVDYAVAHGVVVVVGAGNDNQLGVEVPAACAGALAVGASSSGLSSFLEENPSVPGFPGKIDERSGISNFGSAPGQAHGVDVVAPGVTIASTWICSQADANDGAYACTFPGETPLEITSITALRSGTSFATPLVSGLAALLVSRARDLGVSLPPQPFADTMRLLIQLTARNLPDDPDDVPDAGPSWDGYGRVDFLSAVSAVSILPPGPRDLAITHMTTRKVVALKANEAARAARVMVALQNQGRYETIIHDQGTLERLVRLEVQSLGTCEAPTATLVERRPRKPLPLRLFPRQVARLTFEVPIACANDPLKSSKASPGHEDYRYVATLDHTVLFGQPDDDPADNVCPQAAERTNGATGCGVGDVLTDVTVK